MSPRQLTLLAAALLAGVPAGADAALIPCVSVLAATAAGQSDACGATAVSEAMFIVAQGTVRMTITCGAASVSVEAAATFQGAYIWTPAQDCTLTLTAVTDVAVAAATMS